MNVEFQQFKIKEEPVDYTILNDVPDGNYSTDSKYDVKDILVKSEIEPHEFDTKELILVAQPQPTCLVHDVIKSELLENPAQSDNLEFVNVKSEPCDGDEDCEQPHENINEVPKNTHINGDQLNILIKQESDSNKTKCLYTEIKELSALFGISSAQKTKNEPSCNICKRNCSLGNELDSIAKKTNPSKLYKCDLCKYATLYKCSLKNHRRTHTPENRFSCKFCDFKTIYKRSIRVHLKSHNRASRQLFQCPKCEYTASYETNIKQHFKIHYGNKQFQCHVCGKRYRNLRELAQHFNVHGRDKTDVAQQGKTDEAEQEKTNEITEEQTNAT